MIDLKTVTLAVGYCPALPIGVADLERFTAGAGALLPSLSPASMAFWADEGDRTLSRRELIKAALFENHRQQTDGLLIVHEAAALQPALVTRLVEALRAFPDGGCVASPDLVLLSTAWLSRLASAEPVDRWFAVSNGIGPDRAFLKYMRGLGCPVVELDIAPASRMQANSAVRLPGSVHFLPPIGAKTGGGRSIGELSARIAAAFGAIAALPPNGAIAVYGAGVNGRAVLPLLRDRVAYVIDRNPELRGGQLDGVAVISLDDVKTADAISAILITVVGREGEIRAALRSHLGDRADAIAIVDLENRGAAAAPGPSTNGTRLPMAATPPPATYPRVHVQVPPDIPKPAMLASAMEKTTKRTITKRAVLYTGFPCNIKCKFCYYAYNEANKWHPLEECIRDANLYRHEYGNDCVDITGGEPTAYPKIFDLVEHCATIGLRPTCITNMQVLRDIEKVKRYKDRGLYDFLCSIHGLGETYDKITQKPKGWSNIVRAIGNINSVGLAWRANCTMTTATMPYLRDVATFAFEHGARVMNFINYNPFYEWANVLDADFQARHSEIRPYLVDALEYCDSVGLEVNVRYTPLCQLAGHEEKSYNYPQLSYDHHEWDYCSWYAEETQNPSAKVPRWLTRLADDRAALHLYLAHRNKDHGFAAGVECADCSMRLICDGPTTQYARRYGTGEMTPYGGALVDDPTHFIKRQHKILDDPA